MWLTAPPFLCIVSPCCFVFAASQCGHHNCVPEKGQVALLGA